MKKIVRLLFLLLPACIFAQNSYTDLPGKWRLGLNMGAIWESSDVKAIPGLGGGFNLEKILNKRANAFLGFSFGFRYLGGRTYGLNTSPTYDLSNNLALNGTFNPSVNYDSAQGHFYMNHKTYIQEGNLELKMNFPNLERTTGIILNFWGGIGICKYKTWIDALDKNGKMYDFSSFNGKSVTQSDLSHLMDNKYETLAQGSDPNGTLRFIPSVGIGLGYRLGKGVAIVFEHKISFPGTTYIDGIDYPKNCPVTHGNDFYHYTSASLVFTLYGGHHATQTTSNNNVHNNSTATQTVVTTNTVATNNNYNNNPPPPVVYPPKVIITYPANNFNSPYDYTTVNATVQNVSSSQQITISHNGYNMNHFTFNSYNGTLHFQTFLSHGANSFVITAANQGGTATQSLIINYNPTINASFPTDNTTTTTTVVTTNTVSTSTATVVPTATVQPSHTGTVVSTNTVVPTATVSTTHSGTVVTTNTVAPTLTVSPTHTGTVVTTSTVVPTLTVNPTPTGTIVTTNTTVTTNTVITQNGTVNKKPVVSFINPSVYPEDAITVSYSVVAQVLNVSNASQISVQVNGAPFSGFTFNAVNKNVNFIFTLQQGYNTVTITGTNSFGSDAKSALINHTAVGKPPKVVITTPGISPFTSLHNNLIVSGYVYNVSSANDIKVMIDNVKSNFAYDMNTKIINVPWQIVNQLTSLVEIDAVNNFGSDSKQQVIIFRLDTVKVDTTQISSGSSAGSGNTGVTVPQIDITSPASNPFTSTASPLFITAQIWGNCAQGDVNVWYENNQISFTYNPSRGHLSILSPLKPGSNSFRIDAKNQYGQTSKNIIINYVPVNGTTGGQPGEAPKYNQGSWNMGNIFNGGTKGKDAGNVDQSNPRPTNNGNNGVQPKVPVKPVITNPNPQNVPRTVNPGGNTQSVPGRPTNGGGGRIIPK